MAVHTNLNTYNARWALNFIRFYCHTISGMKNQNWAKKKTKKTKTKTKKYERVK